MKSGVNKLTNTESVLRRKRFAFNAVVRQIETPVGENTIDIEADKLNIRRELFLVAGTHMTPARKRS